MKMLFSLLCLLGLAGNVLAYDLKVVVRWDEMAVDGSIESMIQYYHQGQVEVIRALSNKPSTDGNVKVIRPQDGGYQEFQIEKSAGFLFNIWIQNMVMDEEFAEEEDFFTLANAGIQVTVEDRLNGKSYNFSLPEGTPGLLFRGGAIVDGDFFDFTEMYSQQRIYSVTMIDAKTGKLLPGVQVSVTDSRTGQLLASGMTDDYGVFEQKLEYGKYRAELSREGYITAGHNFEMDLNELPVAMNFALTPQVQEFRIVLTWDAYPRDLDAHLAGPKPEGGRFHIWWQNKIPIGGMNFLDRDDQSSYGPETITIYKPAQGVYEYAVHNFSGRHRSGKKDLSFSKARVDVYGNGRLQASFTVPEGQKGNAWHVFRINEQQQVVPVNQFRDAENSAGIIQ